MTKPIYKMFTSRFTEAWYQLSPEEQNSLLQKVSAAQNSVGGKGVIACDSTWSSEKWSAFGVEVFPDIEALQKYTSLLAEFNWFRYIDSTTLLGTEFPQ